MAAKLHPSRTPTNGGPVTQWEDICGRHRAPSAPIPPFGQTAVERPSSVKDGLESYLWEQTFVTGSAPQRMAHAPEGRASSSVPVTTSDYTDDRSSEQVLMCP